MRDIDTSTHRHTDTPIYLLWLLAVAATISLFAGNVTLGELNQDEGWYLYGARLVAHGKLPYVDFASTQGPVMSFVYALANPLVDRGGVAAGRVFTALLGFACLLCAVWLAHRLSTAGDQQSLPLRHSPAAFMAFTLIGVNVYQSYFCSIVKTYSLTALFLVLGFLLLTFTRGRMAGLAALLSGILLALAAGTRLSAAIILPIVFFSLAAARRRQRPLEKEDSVEKKPQTTDDEQRTTSLLHLWFAGGALVTCGLVFLPFLLKASDSFIFCVARYHTGRDTGGVLSMLLLKAGSVARLVGAYFVPFTFFAVCCLYMLFTPRSTRRCCVFSYPWTAVLWMSILAVALIHLAAPFPYDEYQVMVFPLFAVVLSVLVTNLLQTSGVGQRTVVDAPTVGYCRTSLLLSVLVLVLSLFSVISSPLTQGWVVRDIDRLWIRRQEQPPLLKLREIGRYIKQLAGADTELLTQDPYLAVESGLDLPKGLEMGQFSYFPDMSREDAMRRNVLNKEMLRELLRDGEATVAAFSGYGLAVRSPEVVELTQVEQDELFGILRERYMLFREVDHFGQANTKLRIFLRMEK